MQHCSQHWMKQGCIHNSTIPRHEQRMRILKKNRVEGGQGWYTVENRKARSTRTNLYMLWQRKISLFFFFSVGPRYTTQWARGQGWRVFQPMYYFHSLHGHQQGASVTLLVTLNKGAQFTPCKGSERVKCRVQTSAHRWVNTPWRVLTAQPFFFFF